MSNYFSIPHCAMNKRLLINCIFLLTLSGIIPVFGQSIRQPFDFPILLSGSFGELRSNHFHSGIDFKTQGAEGKPIRAVLPGYVSRISVSPWGYGNALYLDHPDGTTTVYAHLQRFTPEVADYSKEKQYATESFAVNLYPEPGLFEFDQGDLIAYSGNTGSSAGPHLHFEVRDTKTEEVLDPIVYFRDQITDTKPPRINQIMVYPMEGKGVVNGKARKQSFKPVTAKNGKQTIATPIKAWGEIGLGVNAYDYMDNTSNIYGVKEIRLEVDSQLIFHSDIDRFAFDETRYLNSFTDYEQWRNQRSFYSRSYVEPGNRLRFIKSKNRGVVHIDEERTYHFVYTLTDAFGNSTKLSVWIDGSEQDIPEPDTENTTPFHWFIENRFGAKGLRLTIPKGNLYDNLNFAYSVKEDSLALAGVHQLHNQPVALHQQAQLSLRVMRDTLPEKRQYGIVSVRNGKRSWIGGTYQNGWINAPIRELGAYSISQDTKPPVITPLQQENWLGRQQFAFRLTDNLSGVKTYRATLDDDFILFEMDNRSVITHKFNKSSLAKGTHTLILTVTDAAGNESEYIYDFNL